MIRLDLSWQVLLRTYTRLRLACPKGWGLRITRGQVSRHDLLEFEPRADHQECPDTFKV